LETGNGLSLTDDRQRVGPAVFGSDELLSITAALEETGGWIFTWRQGSGGDPEARPGRGAAYQTPISSCFTSTRRATWRKC